MKNFIQYSHSMLRISFVEVHFVIAIYYNEGSPSELHPNIIRSLISYDVLPPVHVPIIVKNNIGIIITIEKNKYVIFSHL